jgi:hypothetical protein
MSRGYIEFWLVWVAVDAVGVPFAFSNGYYPVQDGQLSFTLRDILVNGETNSAYGTFIVEIHDYPKIVAYQEYASSQMIVPLQMLYSLTQLMSSTGMPI